jgi:hypothetical protein
MTSGTELSAVERLAALRHSLEQMTRRIFETATTSDRGGGPAWDRLLGELGVEPPSTDQRLQALSTNVPLSKGPVPAEVRKALEKLRADLSVEVERFRAALDQNPGAADATQDEQLEELDRRLASFVDAEVKRYIAAVRPAPAAAGIFANALATTPSYAADRQGAGVETKMCGTCGAARPAGTDLRTCDFCGGSLF